MSATSAYPLISTPACNLHAREVRRYASFQTVVGLLGSLSVRSGFELFLRYDAAFASNASTQAGSGGFRLLF